MPAARSAAQMLRPAADGRRAAAFSSSGARRLGARAGGAHGSRQV
ncbi:hypothetical protein BMA10399_G0248 [Burkholderia mallei ATCC 10399]|nr:hypothetical protein BMA10399_G0248 [Burkholderia mallei ATCC 10399]